jgi:hypothetical protein
VGTTDPDYRYRGVAIEMLMIARTICNEKAKGETSPAVLNRLADKRDKVIQTIKELWQHNADCADPELSRQCASMLKTGIRHLWRPVIRPGARTDVEVDGLRIAGERPVAVDLSLDEYLKLKEEYIRKRGRAGDYALTYREKEEGDWRKFWLMLAGFDDSYAYVGEVTQYRSKGWDWVKRYKLERDSRVDAELGIKEIIRELSQVTGGIKYGMGVKDVLRIKGSPVRVIPHAAGGSEEWIYEDIKVFVWDCDDKDGGWVRALNNITGDN